MRKAARSSGRWRLSAASANRFGELRRLMPQVTQQMLTLQLREMERDGIVHRRIYPQVPPKLAYSLTEMGRSLQPLLDMMLA